MLWINVFLCVHCSSYAKHEWHSIVSLAYQFWCTRELTLFNLYHFQYNIAFLVLSNTKRYPSDLDKSFSSGFALLCEKQKFCVVCKNFILWYSNCKRIQQKHKQDGKFFAQLRSSATIVVDIATATDFLPESYCENEERKRERNREEKFRSNLKYVYKTDLLAGLSSFCFGPPPPPPPTMNSIRIRFVFSSTFYFTSLVKSGLSCWYRSCCWVKRSN